MATSTELATPLWSPNCINHTPLSSRVMVEPGMESITMLSNDSNVRSPQDGAKLLCEHGAGSRDFESGK